MPPSDLSPYVDLPDGVVLDLRSVAALVPIAGEHGDIGLRIERINPAHLPLEYVGMVNGCQASSITTMLRQRMRQIVEPQIINPVKIEAEAGTFLAALVVSNVLLVVHNRDVDKTKVYELTDADHASRMRAELASSLIAAGIKLSRDKAGSYYCLDHIADFRGNPNGNVVMTPKDGEAIVFRLPPGDLLAAVSEAGELWRMHSVKAEDTAPVTRDPQVVMDAKPIDAAPAPTEG